MGFDLTSLDNQPCKSHHNQTNMDQQTIQQVDQQKSTSQINAEMYSYYEQMIKQLIQKYPLTGDKLAIALILTRPSKATITRNRELSLIDIDKMLSIKNKSLRQGDFRLQNMRMAVDLSTLKNNSFPQRQQNPTGQGRGTFQIFRLVRAAQIHYLQTGRQFQQQEDTVNTSFNNEEIQ